MAVVPVQELNGPNASGGVLLVATAGALATRIASTGQEIVLIEADGALEIEFNSVGNERGRGANPTWDIVLDDVVMIGPVRPNAWAQVEGELDIDLDSPDDVFAFKMPSRFGVR